MPSFGEMATRYTPNNNVPYAIMNAPPKPPQQYHTAHQKFYQPSQVRYTPPPNAVLVKTNGKHLSARPQFLYPAQYSNHFHPQQQYQKNQHPKVSSFSDTKSVNTRQEFRASQPIPVTDNTDLPQSSIYSTNYFANVKQPDSVYAENKNSYTSNKQFVKKRPDNILAFTAADTTDNDDNSENNWSPAQPFYPNNFQQVENQQYQHQERISFYPNTHPEYFSQYGTTTSTTTTKPPKRSYSQYRAEVAQNNNNIVASASQFSAVRQDSLAVLGHSFAVSDEKPVVRHFRKRKPIIKEVEIDSNISNKIKPVVEVPTEDQQPDDRRRYKVREVLKHNSDTENVQSVFVSSTLRAEDPEDFSQSIFITPVEISTEITDTTEAIRSDADTNEDKNVITTKPSTVRKHNRVLHRKILQSNAIGSESCESSCLSNIVSRNYDPVCGSDNKSYANIGRLRCTKICGDHRKFQFNVF